MDKLNLQIEQGTGYTKKIFCMISTSGETSDIIQKKLLLLESLTKSKKSTSELANSEVPN